MSLNYKVAISIIGGLFAILSVLFVLPAIVSFIYKEYTDAFIFIGIAAVIFFSGLLLRKVNKHHVGNLGIREGFFVVSFTWLFLSIVGALPFIISGAIPNAADAIFETASGFSTTGATILSDIESLPKGMLFWRSFTHWIGGMGVLILTIALIPLLYQGKQNIALESTGPSLDKTSSKMTDTAKWLYFIYVAFTLIQVFLLCLGGMSLYDSLIHTFGSVGTGGFSNYGDSVAHFNSLYIEAVIIIFMFICGVSFNLYFAAWKNGIKVIFRNREFRLYVCLIAAATLLISFDLIIEGGYIDFGRTFRDSIFQVVSIITTTGYATTDFNNWPQFAKCIILLLFFCGGCASSTAGGIKVYRVLILFRLVKRSINIRLHPNAVINVSVENKKVRNDTVMNVTDFLFLYFAVLGVGTLLISIDNYDFTTTFTAAASCLGNIGPGLNLVGPVANYGMFSAWSKIVMTLLMIAGRLELYTFLAIFMPQFWNPDRY